MEWPVNRGGRLPFMLWALIFQLWEKIFAARKEIDPFEADEDSLIKNMKNWIKGLRLGKQTRA